MQIGKYIIHVVPFGARDFDLRLPYSDLIVFKTKEKSIDGWQELRFIKSKHIKPNSGIRYQIVKKQLIFLVIKQLN